MMFHGVPLSCINQAAEIFSVPAMMIISVMKIENGRNGDAIKNKNGTYDLGVLQVNNRWLKQLKPYGITQKKLQFDPCVNVEVGTWILAKHMAKKEGWKGVGNYHSFTPMHNARYRQKVKIFYDHLQHVLIKEST
jgi:soluble lytic murein transglycosylase-like protein